MRKKLTTKKPVAKPVEVKKDEALELDVLALQSMADKYEDILEPQIKALYFKMVNFIAASQIPLVHVNSVLDLIKTELLTQLHDGYFKGKGE